MKRYEESHIAISYIAGVATMLIAMLFASCAKAEAFPQSAIDSYCNMVPEVTKATMKARDDGVDIDVARLIMKKSGAGAYAWVLDATYESTESEEATIIGNQVYCRVMLAAKE
jgi:hypothetical protein